MLEQIPFKDFAPKEGEQSRIPFFSSLISAGFPSPADDFLERRLDIREYLIRNETATYYFKVSGDSMSEAGIQNKDILVVDSSITARNGSIVVAILDGEFLVKRLVKEGGKVFLRPESRNPKYKEIEITEWMQFRVWGVCTYAIHYLM